MALALIAPLRARDLGEVKRLLKKAPEEARHASAILAAAGAGWKEGCEALFAHGADLNAHWRNYRPLHALLQEEPHGGGEGPTAERVECLRWLLAHGADPELRGAWPETRALIVAAHVGLPVYVEILKAAGAVVDGFAAAALGEKKVFAKLLKKDAGLATAREGGQLTALMCACGARLDRAAGVEIARSLLEAGADVAALAQGWGHQFDAVYFAASAKNKAAFELLLKSGADATKALVPAIWNAGLDYAKLALQYGADVNAARAEKRPLLSNLITWGQIPQTLWMLEHGADPNQADERGWTALHQAASRGNVKLIEAVLRAGVDRTRKDANGDTALEVAEAKGKEKVLAALR